MSPSLQTMGFFMSDINFCNTKEQLNHLGEVVTGKVDGSPSGADIDTSTLPYTGQVRKTLTGLEKEYRSTADAAIDAYRLLNKGPYASGITLESKFEYITYNGEPYFATNPPYTTTATTPDTDGNLFVSGYTTFENVANKIGNKNELYNSNFLTPSPDAITHPNATPESYVSGTQIFSGVYAGDSGCTITFADGRVNCTEGDYQFKLTNSGGLDRVPVFTSSVSDYDGIPKTTGVSHSLVDGEYIVIVSPAAGDVFSVKLEQGSVATRHEANPVSRVEQWRMEGDVRGWPSDDVAVSISKALKAVDKAIVPKGTYTHKDKTVSLLDGQVIIFENPIINSDGVNFVTFISVVDKKQWAILGSCNYKGSLATGADVGDENGLVIEGCTDYRVENFVSRVTRSHGIHIKAGALAPSPRGDQGQLINCASYECRNGVEMDPDTSSEFCQFVNFNTAGCLDGMIIGAGNTSFVGGNCIDNTRGVTIIGGYNHAHGICSSMNISHNQEWNIKTVSVTNGHTFEACHSYGNGGTTSPIWFENSKGVTFQNGKIDCPVYNDGTSGQNAILNNHMPGVDAQLLGSNPEFLRVLVNWTDFGEWEFNDAAPEYTLVNRGVSTQLIPQATVLVFNSANKDKRALYNTTSGVYTAPVAGTYRIKSSITVTGSGFLAVGSSYVEVKRNTTVIGYMLLSPISDTILLGSIALDDVLSIGDSITLVSQVDGVSPTLAMDTSSLTIELNA